MQRELRRRGDPDAVYLCEPHYQRAGRARRSSRRFREWFAGKRVLDDAQVDKIIRDYDPQKARGRTGVTAFELAENFGVHVDTVYRAFYLGYRTKK